MHDTTDAQDAAAATLLGALAQACRTERGAQAATVAACAGLYDTRVEPGAHHQAVAAAAEFVTEEISVALSVSGHTAHQYLDVGAALATRLVAVRGAFEHGLVSYAQVRTIVDRLSEVHDEAVLGAVEAAVLRQLLGSGQVFPPRRLAGLVDRLLAEADPTLVRTQRERAERDRDIRIHPDTNGMSSIWGLIPAVDGLIVNARLQAMADGVCPDDPRTHAQRRVDALTALTQGRELACACGWCAITPGEPAAPATSGAGYPAGPAQARHHADDDNADNAAEGDDGDDDTAQRQDGQAQRAATTTSCAAGPAPVRRARRRAPGADAPVVQVVIDVATLAGAADLPGVLARYGIIDPTLVRTLAADARWQALLVRDGVPVHLGPWGPTGTAAARTYTPSTAVAALVRARDTHCRFPGCVIPAAGCDLDHVTPYHHTHPHRGGPTAVENLACLCRRHHRAKTAGLWAVTMHADGTQHWTGPTGQQSITTPTGLPTRHPPRSPIHPPVLAPITAPRWSSDLPTVPVDPNPPALFNDHGHWIGYPEHLNHLDAEQPPPDRPHWLKAEQEQRERVAAHAWANRPDAPPPF